MFRYQKSIPLSYERQGYIFFTSRMYAELPERRRQKIRKMCAEHGGEYADALLEFMTTDQGETKVCARHNLSPSTLRRAKRRYYEGFPSTL